MRIIYNNMYNMQEYRRANKISFTWVKYAVSGLISVPDYIFYTYIHYNIRVVTALCVIFSLKNTYNYSIIITVKGGKKRSPAAITAQTGQATTGGRDSCPRSPCREYTTEPAGMQEKTAWRGATLQAARQGSRPAMSPCYPAKIITGQLYYNWASRDCQAATA